MTADRTKIARLRRIERLRGIEHRVKIGEAAQAEAALAGAGTLAERTARLAASYAGRANAQDGAGLALLHRFAAGLEAIHAGAKAGAATARDRADAAKRGAAVAEKRAEVVAMLASSCATALARRDSQRTHAELARKLKDSPRQIAARES